ncbi:MAG: sulfotransferase, partial [Acidimicrobiales bacterium]
MLDADHVVESAMDRTGLADFGATGWRDGLDRLVDALNREADLTEMGTHILGSRLEMLLANRLRVRSTVDANPDITKEEVEGPLVIIGLPRTGTTALSNLLAADPQVRSVRLWESSDPVPPPEADHQHDDPRIEAATNGLELMYETFPRMRSLHFQSPTGPTECQDLLGMEFRTAHFDGMARVPSYMEWVVDCDMTGAYESHRQVLQLLQWHCPPRLWHLKTPVHMLALDALRSSYPSAKFVWTHRDPAAVLGSVCSLIAYTRSWASDRDDAEELGRGQLLLWAEAIRRALDFRNRIGEEHFADITHAELQSDPVGALNGAYGRLGLELGEGRGQVAAWA